MTMNNISATGVLSEMIFNGFIVLSMFIVIKKEYCKWKHWSLSQVKKIQQINFAYIYELCNLILLQFKIELVVATYSRTVWDRIVVVRVFGCVV